VILDEILAHKRLEVAARKRLRPLPPLPGLLSESRSFAAALRAPGVAFIAEIKRKSPSGGELRPGASAAELAAMYKSAGAAALSVLTDAAYFGGTDDDLVTARHVSGLPALRKDFVVDPYQIYEARALGADAVLLIVRALSDPLLRELIDLTRGLGIEALVEAHSAREVERAIQACARIIGVNNRDLDTLATDVSLAPRLRSMVPPECVYVAESGISQPEQVAELLAAGVDAILIGESLLRSPDPGLLLRSLISAGTPLPAAGAQVPASGASV
jgi:indole-3-glycerol phosphate synthase